jgi:hypothetical protein
MSDFSLFIPIALAAGVLFFPDTIVNAKVFSSFNLYQMTPLNSCWRLATARVVSG